MICVLFALVGPNCFLDVCKGEVLLTINCIALSVSGYENDYFSDPFPPVGLKYSKVEYPCCRELTTGLCSTDHPLGSHRIAEP